METITETKTEEKVQTTKEPKVIHSAAFLVLAEYYGYVSPLVEYAENLCKGKTIDIAFEHAICIDAKNVLQLMLKDFTLEDIRELYDSLYEIIFEDYEANLLKHSKDDLPF